MKAAKRQQSSQAVGFPYCLTHCSHFLQIVDVFPLLWSKKEQKLGNEIRFRIIWTMHFRVIDWKGGSARKGRLKLIITSSVGTLIGSRCILQSGRLLDIPVMENKFQCMTVTLSKRPCLGRLSWSQSRLTPFLAFISSNLQLHTRVSSFIPQFYSLNSVLDCKFSKK